MKAPAYDLRPCTPTDVAHLFVEHHAYKGTGRLAVYSFAVFEDDEPVAAFMWQPPPPGAARSVCKACPQGVLSLSRMVAVPPEQRRLRHISKPLRRQMRQMIDRTRWPVLVTYSDESVGHTGYVYQCSGWKKTTRRKTETLTLGGVRVSRYADGGAANHEGAAKGTAWIQRWEHWTDISQFDLHWERVPVPGKRWRSGAQAYTYRRRAT